MQDNFEEINPKYYQSGFAAEELQCIDITRHLKFAPGNAFKYIWRAGNKNLAAEEKPKAKKATKKAAAEAPAEEKAE